MTRAMPGAAIAARARVEWIVVLAGVSAALHVGKLSPALPVLQQTLQISLVQAGFLLSMVQLAGVLLGLAIGLAADGVGLRRSMLTGLVLLSLASFAGGLSGSVGALLVWRALEGVGVLLVCLPGPALIRRLVPPERLRGALGLWGAYMPLGTALALVSGPLVMRAWGWQAWWWLPAGVTAAMAVWMLRAIPPDRRTAAPLAGAVHGAGGRLRRTLRARGPWLVALAFGVYAAQWLAVIGLLPAMLSAGGWTTTSVAWPLAVAAAANIVGNVSAGRLLERGTPSTRLLTIGFLVMAAGALLAFAGPAAASDGVALLRYAGVLAFSMVGGIIPGTLFSVAVAVAPGDDAVATTVGWMQQWSSIGQFVGPPLVAWVAATQGGWQWTWCVTGALALAGLGIVALLRREVRR